MNILITVCARGGSKGIPGKNIKELNGKPLLAYTINTAKKFAKEHDVDIELSTDDEGEFFEGSYSTVLPIVDGG